MELQINVSKLVVLYKENGEKWRRYIAMRQSEPNGLLSFHREDSPLTL